MFIYSTYYITCVVVTITLYKPCFLDFTQGIYTGGGNSILVMFQYHGAVSIGHVSMHYHGTVPLPWKHLAMVTAMVLM